MKKALAFALSLMLVTSPIATLASTEKARPNYTNFKLELCRFEDGSGIGIKNQKDESHGMFVHKPLRVVKIAKQSVKSANLEKLQQLIDKHKGQNIELTVLTPKNNELSKWDVEVKQLNPDMLRGLQMQVDDYFDRSYFNYYAPPFIATRCRQEGLNFFAGAILKNSFVKRSFIHPENPELIMQDMVTTIASFDEMGMFDDSDSCIQFVIEESKKDQFHDGKNLQSIINIAKYLSESGRIKESDTIFSNLKACSDCVFYSDTISYLENLADTKYKTGRFAEAMSAYKMLVAKTETNKETTSISLDRRQSEIKALVALAKFSASERNLEQAKKYLLQADELYKKSFDSESLWRINQVFSPCPNDLKNMLSNLSGIGVLPKSTVVHQPWYQTHQAYISLTRKDFACADKIVEEIIAKESRRTQHQADEICRLINLAKINIKLGRKKEALYILNSLSPFVSATDMTFTRSFLLGEQSLLSDELGIKDEKLWSSFRNSLGFPMSENLRILALAYGFNQEPARGIRILQRIMETCPDDEFRTQIRLADLALLHTLNGDKKNALKIMDSVLKPGKRLNSAFRYRLVQLSDPLCENNTVDAVLNLLKKAAEIQIANRESESRTLYIRIAQIQSEYGRDAEAQSTLAKITLGRRETIIRPLKRLKILKKRKNVKRDDVVALVEAAEISPVSNEFDYTNYRPVVEYADSQKLQTFELCRLKSKIASYLNRRGKYAQAALQMDSVINTPLGMNPNEMNQYRVNAITYNASAERMNETTELILRSSQQPEFTHFSALSSLMVPHTSCVADFVSAACKQKQFETAENVLKSVISSIKTSDVDERNYASLLNLILADVYLKWNKTEKAKSRIDIAFNLEDSESGELSRKCWSESAGAFAIQLFKIVHHLESSEKVLEAQQILLRYEQLQRKWQGKKNPQRIQILMRLAHLEGLSKNINRQGELLSEGCQISEWNYGNQVNKSAEIRCSYASWLRDNLRDGEAERIAVIVPKWPKYVSESGLVGAPVDPHTRSDEIDSSAEHSLNEFFRRNAVYMGEGSRATLSSLNTLIKFYTQHLNIFKLAELRLRKELICKDICGRSYNQKKLPYDLSSLD